jgi:hypothetical protein
MTDEEIIILDFLKAAPETWYARKEIARKAVKRILFERNPHWPDAHLNALVARKLIEQNDSGYYKMMKDEILP